MKPAVYKMKREGWKYYFELHVSRTTKAMLAHCKELGREAPLDTLAQVSPFCRSNIGTKDFDGLFAIMFVSEENLGVGLLAHECLHVAMAYERFVNGFKMCYGPQCGDDEERLAYLMTDAIKGVVNTLRDNGHLHDGNQSKELNQEPSGKAGNNTGKARP